MEDKRIRHTVKRRPRKTERRGNVLKEDNRLTQKKVTPRNETKHSYR